MLRTARRNASVRALEGIGGLAAGSLGAWKMGGYPVGVSKFISCLEKIAIII